MRGGNVIQIIALKKIINKKVLFMAQGIPEEIVDEIRQRTDLVGLAGEYLKLDRRGKNMVGLCPFHNEKTPSFTVSPEKQLFHCFGCGASGNAFSLIMQLENMNFPEAARFLAGRAGIRIPEERKVKTDADNLKEKIYKLNMLALKFYAYQLHNSKNGKKALDYLIKRGIKHEIIEMFKLGYAPADWTGFFNYAKKKGADPELIVKAGLASSGRDSSYYDRFRDRVIFPISGISGKVIGFGGRTLSDHEKGGPKYLNSPETMVFDKSKTLYGLNLGRDEIRRQKRAVVVEGYTDVLSAYQAGIRNVVASLGTALTEDQARLLRHQAETVITAYDSDTAGAAATWRGLAILQSTGCLVQVAELPEGDDPDSFISREGAEAFTALVDTARPLMEYRLEKLKTSFNLGSDKGRINYLDELMPFLMAAVNQVEQDYYLRKAAEELNVDEEALRSELKKRKRSSASYRIKDKNNQKKTNQEQGIKPEEKILISLMLQSKEIADKGRNLLQLDFFQDQRVKIIVSAIWDSLGKEELLSAEKLINRFSDQEVSNIISKAATDPALQDLPDQTAKRMADDCIKKIYQAWAKKKQLELQKKIKELEAHGDFKELEILLKEHQQLLLNKDGISNR